MTNGDPFLDKTSGFIIIASFSRFIGSGADIPKIILVELRTHGARSSFEQLSSTPVGLYLQVFKLSEQS